MKVGEIYLHLLREQERRPYFVDVEILEQTSNLIKARMVISAGLFVQIYRNERYNTTNLALIHEGRRLYARDEVDGKWHRHLPAAPDEHDFSPEGCRQVDLPNFLDEVERILAESDLP